MFSKLATLFPWPQGKVESEMKLAAYLDETKRVPALALSHALKRLVQKRSSQFVPSVYEILRESARVIREWKAKAAGREASEWGPEGEIEIDVDRYLAHAPQVMQLAASPAALQLPEKATLEQRKEGAELIERFVSNRRRIQ